MKTLNRFDIRMNTVNKLFGVALFEEFGHYVEI